MPDNNVRVKLTGDASQLKSEMQSGGGILDSFRAKVDQVAGPGVGGLVKSLGGLVGAAGGAWAAFRLGKDVLIGGLEAADELRTSVTKLEGTAKLTGVALSELQLIAAQGAEKFKLPAVVANEFAAELAKLATKAGDVSKAGPALEAFLDIGAARGLKPAEILKAVQQAILGIDEGTDKLFSKNPSVLYKEYADAIGTTAGKLTDQQKAQALLTAALGDGLKVHGDYERVLKSSAGATTDLSSAWRNVKTEIGKGLQPLRDTGAALLAWPLSAIASGLKAITDEFAKLTPQGGLAKTIENGLRQAAGLVDKVTPAKKKGMPFELVFTYSKEELEGAIKERERLIKIHQAATTKATKEFTDAVADIAKAAHDSERGELAEHVRKYLNASDDLFTRLKALRETGAKVTRDTSKEQGEATDALSVIQRRNLMAFADTILPVRNLMKEHREMIGPLTALKAGTDLVTRAELEQVAASDDLGRMIGTTAGAMGDALGQSAAIAVAFGGIGAEAGQAISAVAGLANAVSTIASGDTLGGIAGGVSALRSLANMFTGESESSKKVRLALEATKATLELHRRTLGDLIQISTPGRQLTGVEAALKALFAGPQRPRLSEGDLGKALVGQGLTMADLEGVAKTFGIDLRPNGRLDRSQLQSLMSIIGETEPLQFRNDFGGQMERIRRGGAIGAIPNEFAAILGVLNDDKIGSTSLGALAGGINTRTQEGRQAGIRSLRDLFNSFGSLSSSEQRATLGNLNGQEFLQTIERLVELLKTGLEDLPATGTGTVPEVGGTGATPPQRDGPTVLPPIPSTAVGVGLLEGALPSLADPRGVLGSAFAPLVAMAGDVAGIRGDTAALRARSERGAAVEGVGSQSLIGNVETLVVQLAPGDDTGELAAKIVEKTRRDWAEDLRYYRRAARSGSL